LPPLPASPDVPMSHTKSALLALSLAVIAGSSAQAQPAASPSRAAGPYRVVQTFRIGGAGGWDYLTVDPQRKLLYVPRSTHTMVIDAASGRTVADIPGQRRNHGVAIVPSAGRGFISDGQDASVTIFDLKTNKVLGKVKAADDADGIIFDPNGGKVLVSCGDANVMVVISPDVDPQTGKADATVALGGKPEFLVADQGAIYVNLVDKDQVAVIDSKTMKVVHKWPTAPGGAPVGMSMDPVNRRLFVGCRKPQKLIVMNADDGKVLDSLPIGAGVDATQFDGDIFASCRDGTLAIARETSPGRFAIVQTVATKQGARTMGLDPTTHTLYLPTAESAGENRGMSRPATQPGSFMILVVRAAGK
jgi:DNA-binding beta-propeller fold protein YncE